MTITREGLEAELTSSVGWAMVTAVADELFSVLLPSTRYAHDHTQVTVQRVDGMWRLTDAGEIAAAFGSERHDVVAMLRCAGADMTFDSRTNFAQVDVADDDELGDFVITFAHYLSAAPLMWRAHNCALEEDDRLVPVVEPSTKLLARQTKAELVRRCGSRYSSVLRLGRPLTGAAGIRTTLPLSVSVSHTAAPRLIAACIDTGASAQSVRAAQGHVSFVLDVSREYTVPKWLVVKGDEHAIDQMGEFYDRDNLVVVSFDDLDQLESSVREVMPQLA
ncbi:MAG: hypothetical protein ABMA25_02335 [Ilumatobacteraceae bacterium]